MTKTIRVSLAKVFTFIQSSPGYFQIFFNAATELFRNQLLPKASTGHHSEFINGARFKLSYAVSRG
ncbi:hypothetical protein BH11BAC3_BH11BAC3_47430 [soil metagenome]